MQHDQFADTRGQRVHPGNAQQPTPCCTSGGGMRRASRTNWGTTSTSDCGRGGSGRDRINEGGRK
eukprot:13384991-Alexandrium_andersonii.AAC.1